MQKNQEKEKCVVRSCKKETPYTKETHIDGRRNYIEGIGQLCENCYQNIYGKLKMNEKHLSENHSKYEF